MTDSTRDDVSAVSQLQTLFLSRRLFWTLTMTDLKSRYIGSSLGFFWTVVNPVIELVTYTFVFHLLLQVRFHAGQTTEQYVLYLFCGMVAWGGFADGVVRATSSVREGGGLLRKVNFPAVVLPAQMVATAFINQLFRTAVLALFCILIGDGLTWHALLLGPFLLAQACFTLGVGLFLSVASAYFRDAAHWVNTGLLIGMFVTPVVYPASVWPREYTILLYPNPMAQYIGIYQGLLLGHHLPGAITSVIYAFLAAGISLVVGASVFAHHRRRFVDLV